MAQQKDHFAEYEPEEVKITRMETLKDMGLDTDNGILIEGEGDGTRYSLIVIPFSKTILTGYFATTNGYLVINPYDKTSYVFSKTAYTSWDYLGEKLVRGYPSLWKTDAKILTQIFDKAKSWINARLTYVTPRSES